MSPGDIKTFCVNTLVGRQTCWECYESKCCLKLNKRVFLQDNMLLNEIK